MNISLCPNIEWVGYVDWSLRDFHGYNAERGSTYNAYLVRDEKPALIDAVKAAFAPQLLEHLAALIDPAAVTYVVCNHAEPDHSGGLPQVMARLPQATLLCNARCRTILGQHYDTSAWKIRVVSEGNARVAGPPQPGVRGNADGTLARVDVHLCAGGEAAVFHGRLRTALRHRAAFRPRVRSGNGAGRGRIYYANIVCPYSAAVAAAIEKVAALDVEMIAPSHGIVWQRHVPVILEAYRSWVSGRAKAKVLIIYDTMWESTAHMAEEIFQGACQPGVTVARCNLQQMSLTRMAAEVLDAAAVAFGCPTLNRGMTPPAAAALYYLQGLRPAGKLGLAFGSYGWGVGGPEAIQEGLKTMGVGAAFSRRSRATSSPRPRCWSVAAPPGCASWPAARWRPPHPRRPARACRHSGAARLAL